MTHKERSARAPRAPAGDSVPCTPVYEGITDFPLGIYIALRQGQKRTHSKREALRMGYIQSSKLRRLGKKTCAEWCSMVYLRGQVINLFSNFGEAKRKEG